MPVLDNIYMLYLPILKLVQTLGEGRSWYHWSNSNKSLSSRNNGTQVNQDMGDRRRQFMDSLVYTESSGPVKATNSDTVSKKLNK